MTRVYVGIGSNIDRETNIRNAVKLLADHFGELTISSVFESKPLGFEGDNFYNLVIGFNTVMTLPEVSLLLRDIEFKFGRKRNEQRFLSRKLDLDLLLFGDLVRHDDEYDIPREDIRCYSFVLCPMAEIAGNLKHPECGQSYSELWEACKTKSHTIWPVELKL